MERYRRTEGLRRARLYQSRACVIPVCERTCTVSEVPSCLGMIRVQIWKQPFLSSRTPARMPQLSTPRRVLDDAYLQ